MSLLCVRCKQHTFIAYFIVNARHVSIPQYASAMHKEADGTRLILKWSEKSISSVRTININHSISFKIQTFVENLKPILMFYLYSLSIFSSLIRFEPFTFMTPYIHPVHFILVVFGVWCLRAPFKFIHNNIYSHIMCIVCDELPHYFNL